MDKDTFNSKNLSLHISSLLLSPLFSKYRKCTEQLLQSQVTLFNSKQECLVFFPLKK